MIEDKTIAALCKQIEEKKLELFLRALNKLRDHVFNTSHYLMDKFPTSPFTNQSVVYYKEHILMVRKEEVINCYYVDELFFTFTNSLIDDNNLTFKYSIIYDTR